MEVHQASTPGLVKIGEKGQFVIPKEARDIFGFHPGDELLVLGDTSAASPSAKAMQRNIADASFPKWTTGATANEQDRLFLHPGLTATPTRRSASCASSPRAVTRSATLLRTHAHAHRSRRRAIRRLRPV